LGATINVLPEFFLRGFSMTLLPFVSRRLLGAIGLVFLCCLPAIYGISAQAAELEGTRVPLDSSIPAVSSVPAADIEVPLAPAPVAPIDEPAPPVVVPDHSYPVEYQDDHTAAEFEQRMERLIKTHSRGSSIDLSQMVPITAIVFLFGGPIFLIGLLITKRYHNKQLHRQSLNDNIDKLLAAGRDIPVELLRGDGPKTAEQMGNRDKGVRNICIGTGVLIFLTILTGIDIGSIGFIWIALGVSQVVIWYLNQPKTEQQLEQQVEQRD
jgi:hypothetical protein